jgi:hypothetical protein
VRTAFGEVWSQFQNPEEGGRLSLEAVTRGLVQTKLTEETMCVLH